jgi:hypothetical protein
VACGTRDARGSGRATVDTVGLEESSWCVCITVMNE